MITYQNALPFNVSMCCIRYLCLIDGCQVTVVYQAFLSLYLPSKYRFVTRYEFHALELSSQNWTSTVMPRTNVYVGAAPLLYCEQSLVRFPNVQLSMLDSCSSHDIKTNFYAFFGWNFNWKVRKQLCGARGILSQASRMSLQGSENILPKLNKPFTLHKKYMKVLEVNPSTNCKYAERTALTMWPKLLFFFTIYFLKPKKKYCPVSLLEHFHHHTAL